MFMQQAFRVVATPVKAQQQPSLLDSALRMHYTAKAREYASDVVKVLRIDILTPVLVDATTQADIILSVEADTLSFFKSFTQSFFRDELTDSMDIRILR